MGVGWISVPNQLKFQGRLENYPSSTRAELVAIQMSLLSLPLDATANIMTDSQASIDTINKNNMRYWLKLTNRSIVNSIVDIIRNKNLTVNFIKVKAHSGIIENEKADQLANDGIIKGIEIDWIKTDSNILDFTPMWKDHVIDIGIRDFIKNYTAISEEADW